MLLMESRCLTTGPSDQRRGPWPTGRSWRGAAPAVAQHRPGLVECRPDPVERQRQADKTQVAAGLCLNHAERLGLRVGDDLVQVLIGPFGMPRASSSRAHPARFFGLPICPTRRKTARQPSAISAASTRP